LAHGGIDAVLMEYWSTERDNLPLLQTVGALAPGAVGVLTTAFAIEGLEEQARALGAAAVVHKPFDVFSIEPVLRRACQAGRADRREDARGLPGCAR
jgi:AmiR/NasT family two-component response regulator